MARRICVNLNAKYGQNGRFHYKFPNTRIYLGLLHNICIQASTDKPLRERRQMLAVIATLSSYQLRFICASLFNPSILIDKGCLLLHFLLWRSSAALAFAWVAQPIYRLARFTRPNKRKIFTWVSFTLCQQSIIKLFCVIDLAILNIGK